MKLNEKLFKIPINISDDDYSDHTEIEEVEVSDNEIKHWIETKYSAGEIMDLAKMALENNEEDTSDLDLDQAIDIVMDYEEYDDIPEFADIEDYIQKQVDDYYMTDAIDNYDDEQSQIDTDKDLETQDLI